MNKLTFTGTVLSLLIIGGIAAEDEGAVLWQTSDSDTAAYLAADSVPGESSGELSSGSPGSVDTSAGAFTLDSTFQSGEPVTESTFKETCSELYQELKNSDCGRSVFKYIKGMSVKIGASFNTSSLELKKNDTLYARLVGLLTPAPYYAVSLSPKYFGRSGFGYQVAFDYTSSSTVQQVIQRGDQKEYYDLHSLSILNLIALTPSLFYDLVGSRENLESFLRLGLGIGVGWSSVKGVAYLTEVDDAAGFCHETSTDLLNGDAGKDQLYEDCRLEPFEYSSLGGSVRLFFDGRRKWFYGSFEAVGVGLKSNRFEISPTAIKLKIAYILDI